MREPKKPEYSIIIPCYNEEKFIGDTLQSLQNQAYKGKYEIIVVNNNSTDRSVGIARQFKVRIVDQKRPGVCFARQKGLEVSKGKIVISTDADTIFKPDWLIKIDREFKKDPTLLALSGSCRFIKAPWWGKIYPYILFGYVNLTNKIFGKPCYITATNTAFRKEFFEGYNLSLTQGGDELDLLDRISKKGKFKFIFNNPVYTSSRRLNKGIWYNIFVSFIYYYLIAYKVNRFFNRQIIGMAPAYRENNRRRLQLTPVFSLFGVIIVLFLFSSGLISSRFDYSQDAIRLVHNIIRQLINKLT